MAHGVLPNAVYINSSHYFVLMEHVPGIFTDDPEVKLGFRLIVVSDAVLTHPEAAHVAVFARGNESRDNTETRYRNTAYSMLEAVG